MRRLALWILVLGILAAFAAERNSGREVCGTGRDTAAARVFLHRQAARARAGMRLLSTPAYVSRDQGDIAILSDGDGVVSRLNQFNLDQRNVLFTPAGAAAYRFSAGVLGYDADAAAAGAPLAGLGDDDCRRISLPFAFRFFGSTYSEAWVNSDGNLTFTAGDNFTDRSASRMFAAAPRIAPLFDDLDPGSAGEVRVLAEPSRVVVSWVSVPEFSSTGSALRVTFQAALYPDGRILFSYNGVSSSLVEAVVGISPGSLQGSSTLLDFASDASAEYSAMVAEWFASSVTLDVVGAAQKFYATHEDAYDYLVFYNTLDLYPGVNVLAVTHATRPSGGGIGIVRQDEGASYGSPSRLKAVLDMGPISEYDADPLGPVAGRPGDTPLSILAHETGHLFLAFASISDPAGTKFPMLGYQNAHWSFLFNSEASFLEGERILDQGEGASPRFVTAETVRHYSPLDQYLMGLRAAADVPETLFVVENPSPLNSPRRHPPPAAVRFDGSRRDVPVAELVLASGRRTPDSTVAQRRFRFGFALVTPGGAAPSAGDLAKLETLRSRFADFFAQGTDYLGSADPTLRRLLAFSIAPAAGVPVNGSATIRLNVSTAPAQALTVRLEARGGFARIPETVTIPAGATSVEFSADGLRAGVAELAAFPTGGEYESAYALLNVAAHDALRLVAVSGDHQKSTGAGMLPEPVVVRLTDQNGLAYPGARITAATSTGSAGPLVSTADASGLARVQWSPGAEPSNRLTLALEGAPEVSLSMSAGVAAPQVDAVQNAASFNAGVSAGAIGTIWGSNFTGGETAAAPSADWPLMLGGVRVTLGGRALPLLYVSAHQINFLVPQDAPQGPAAITVQAVSGAPASAGVQVEAAQPGIFPGAIVRSGNRASAANEGVSRGEYIEIYCTGLGATRLQGGLNWTAATPTVLVGGAQAKVTYSGLAPGYVGLYQVNAEVPAGAGSGVQPVTVSFSQLASNPDPVLVK